MAHPLSLATLATVLALSTAAQAQSPAPVTPPPSAEAAQPLVDLYSEEDAQATLDAQNAVVQQFPVRTAT